MTVQYKTEQEKFWATEFGCDYIGRNTVEMNLPSRLKLFSRILERTRDVTEIFEFGANIGNNLHALHALLPEAKLKALEINSEAVEELKSNKWMCEVHQGSLLESSFENSADLTFTSGVLIHINPDKLQKAYEQLYKASRKYVMICEYYNPSPVSIPYRGHEDRLFKRDFAGEMMDTYSDLKLIDYGFAYHRDPKFPMDDLNWFLMEK
ncbi:MAG: pseudaminic acid biosynthesis-associated methylase [Alphaproteobacteria bacterium]